jgi:hypothetical protein
MITTTRRISLGKGTQYNVFDGHLPFPYKLAGAPQFLPLLHFHSISDRPNRHLSTMFAPTYADEKQEPVYSDVLDSGGSSSVNTLNGLIAEGENPFNPTC